MIRYILAHNNENIFKDKRSFKTETYAKTKQANFREWETTFNQRCDVEIQAIEIETSEEKLQSEIHLLRKLIPSLEEVLSFGTPKPDENPNMYVVWEKAHKLLAEVSSP